VLIGSAEDRAYCKEVEKLVSDNSLINLSGNLTPLQSAVMIGKSKCLITVDSAAAHLGASTETPIVQIYGSTVPALGFYPLTSKNIVIENNSLDCRPCTDHGRTSCPLKHFKCIEDINPVEVLGAVRQLTTNSSYSNS
jgi:heptosyltransferase-2